MNIFEALREDHDIQRKLLDQLTDTSGETETRKAVFSKLKKELRVHADAEERYFYKPMISKDLTQDKARHSIAEHHDIDELLENLESTDMSSPAWLRSAKDLKEMVTHHLDEEEHEVFQLAGKALDDNQKQKLADTYRDYVNKNR
ncbi:hemerythrin domain-containing protein [Robertkochia aurantiaca]|uniref:hemerythrin domain-containing protein n=1 Tax=Robertkochia aurantiaca TaxID=2873700 RepID=UPI001CCBE387|nr:hemerythrin domain-containing protein [Robertkochia sp. 3YJGBD-33]